MPGEPQILACVDGSAHLTGVCEHAAWLCTRLKGSIELLHVDEPSWVREGSSSTLADQPICMDRGPRLNTPDPVLEEAAYKLSEVGVRHGRLCHARGRFVSIAASLAAGAQLLVMGRRGETHQESSCCFGDNVVQMLRLCPTSVFLAARTFLPISRALVVCDTQADASALSAFLATNSLLDGLALEIAAAASGPKSRVKVANDGAIKALDEGGLERRLDEEHYDLIVLPRSTLVDPLNPDALSQTGRKLMTWRLSLLVY